jgi:hypothetical protein
MRDRNLRKSRWPPAKGLPCSGTRAQDEGMTGDPDDGEDILGFGTTDRAPSGRRRPGSGWLRLRSDQLRLRLDRVTLRLTRRPRLAATIFLTGAALAAGGVAYLAPGHAAAPPAAAQPSRPSSLTQPQSAADFLPGDTCPGSYSSAATAAALRQVLKQLEKQYPGETFTVVDGTITGRGAGATMSGFSDVLVQIDCLQPGQHG